MRAEGMISLVNAREVISASEEGAIPLVTSGKAISLGKGTSFQNRFEAKLPRCEATQNRESTRFLGELIPIQKQD